MGTWHVLCQELRPLPAVPRKGTGPKRKQESGEEGRPAEGPPVFPILQIPLTAVGSGPEESPCHLRKASVQASEMAQQVETLAAKNGAESIPGIHMVEGEGQLLQFLSDLHRRVHTHTHK